MSPEDRLASHTVDLPENLQTIDAYCVEHRWPAVPPVVPPAEARVRGMLAAVRRDPQESLGDMPPGWRAATIEKLAINAVMAGGLPSYFPVIVRAGEGV